MASLGIILIAFLALILPAIGSTTSSPSTLATVPATSSASIIVSTVTVSPVPAPSDAINTNDTSAAARFHYQPIINIDYPGQDALLWIRARSYEECLRHCDAYNADNHGNGTIFCKAALFAPDRINGLNDCYLKKSLDMPQLANITLISGIKLDCNHSASSSTSSVSSSVALNGTSAASATASSTFQTSTIATKSISSSSLTDTGRPSISFSFNPTLEPTRTSPSHTMTTPALPHVSTASNLAPSSSPPTEVLTLPTATHTHEVM